MNRFQIAVITMILAISTIVGTRSESPLAADAPAKLLRHVVLVKFVDGAKPEQIAEAEKLFAGLKDQIQEIEDFEWGTDNSPEKISQGYTHCFLVTFKSEADRDAYLPHKAHQAFVTKVKPLFDKVLVVDYWAKG